MNKINLTRLRELAAKAGEGSDPMEKQRNADAFMNTISPIDVMSVIDEIERLKKTLKEACCCSGHQDYDGSDILCDGCEALKEHAERFE